MAWAMASFANIVLNFPNGRLVVAIVPNSASCLDEIRKLVSDLTLERPTDVDPKPYRTDRF